MADTDHMYVVSYGLDSTLTNSGNIADIVIPLKPASKESYKDFDLERKETGDVISFYVSLKKPQKGVLNEADFILLTKSHYITITGGLLEENKTFDNALAEAPEYA